VSKILSLFSKSTRYALGVESPIPWQKPVRKKRCPFDVSHWSDKICLDCDKAAVVFTWLPFPFWSSLALFQLNLENKESDEATEPSQARENPFSADQPSVVGLEEEDASFKAMFIVRFLGCRRVKWLFSMLLWMILILLVGKFVWDLFPSFLQFFAGVCCFLALNFVWPTWGGLQCLLAMLPLRLTSL